MENMNDVKLKLMRTAVQLFARTSFNEPNSKINKKKILCIVGRYTK